MKKILALLLAAVMCLSLVACGGGSEDSGTQSAVSSKTQSVTEAELVGEWYEVKSADRLVLNSDSTLDYYRDNGISQSGNWKLNDNIIDANNVYIDSDLTIEIANGIITLKNDEYTFMQWSGLPKDALSIGESGKKENIIITLTNVSFTTETPSAILNSVWDKDIEEFAPQDGMTYAKISVDITNMSKQEINIPEINLKFDVVLDYNDGFRYATHDNQKSYFVTDTEYVIHDGIGGQTGSDIQIQPLQEKTIEIYIPCPELIANDDSAPLTVGIISHYDTEIYYCEYSIR